jgi:hypothetical protein
MYDPRKKRLDVSGNIAILKVYPKTGLVGESERAWPWARSAKEPYPLRYGD